MKRVWRKNNPFLGQTFYYIRMSYVHFKIHKKIKYYSSILPTIFFETSYILIIILVLGEKKLSKSCVCVTVV